MKKVLIANRGEIAVRVARALREMSLCSVAIYSDADRGALHVRLADEAHHVGAAPATESYLDAERVLDVAQRAGCDAIHPGYGFLSENADFADACTARGIAFIGPPATAMRKMASKTEARKTMADAGVPIVPGGPAATLDEALVTASEIGFPVMLKAVAGGGGKGMRRIHDSAQLQREYAVAKSEAKRAFLDDSMYLEKYLDRPRHVEIQVLGDQHGTLHSLFERDCSAQRRNQKIIEESPGPHLPAATLARMSQVSAQGAAAIGYFSAGTFEFLLDQSGQFFFLEMNTRLQVEHGVTELVSGLDIVEQMVRIARGEALNIVPPTAHHGHAIELRVYAEDPARGFVPCPGHIRRLRLPSGPGVRNDEGAASGDELSPYYDPLISKLLIWGRDRAQALRRAQRALREYVIEGVQTNLDFLANLVAHPRFAQGDYDISFVETELEALSGTTPLDGEELLQAVAAAALKHHLGKELGSSRSGAASQLSAQPSAWVTALRPSRWQR